MQLTTDGHKGYLSAVEGAFGIDVDYAMLVKLYGGNQGDKKESEHRHSPGKCLGALQGVVTGTTSPASPASISPCASRLRCRLASAITSGRWKREIMVGCRETIYILSPMRPIPRREETCGNRGPQL